MHIDGPTHSFELRRTGPDLTDHEGFEWIYLTCGKCRRYARFSALRTYIVEQPPAEIGNVRDFHTIACCDCCGDVAYVKCFEVDFDPDWWFDYEFHYPSSGRDVPSGLPEGVSLCFGEAVTCFNAKSYIAALVMCRRTIEAVLSDKGIKKKSLVEGIAELQRRGMLHQSLAEIADTVRTVGNAGAHYVAGLEITRELAEQALDITGRLLDLVYLMAARLTEIKARIALTTNKPSQP